MARLSQDDLLEELREQLGLLTSLALAYDEGREAMSRPLSVSMRVLLHHSATSHALLQQLGFRDAWPWIDSCPPPVEGNLLPSLGLVRVDNLESGARYRPLSARTRYGGTLGFDDPEMNAKPASFDAWWSRPVLTVPGQPARSRSQILLALANKLGGAHVDPSPSAWARDLRSGRLLKAVNAEGDPISDPMSAAVRQIAQEVIETLDARLTGLYRAPEGLRGLIVQTEVS